MVKLEHWDDLRKSASGGSTLPWHRDVLAERLRRLDSGTEPVSPWEEAKERIHARIRAGRPVATNAAE